MGGKNNKNVAHPQRQKKSPSWDESDVMPRELVRLPAVAAVLIGVDLADLAVHARAVTEQGPM